MDLLDIAVKVAAILGAIGVPSVIGLYLRRKEGHDMARREEAVLILGGIKAIGKLAFATADAVKNCKVNGVMDNAIEEYQDYASQLDAFLTKQAVAKTH